MICCLWVHAFMVVGSSQRKLRFGWLFFMGVVSSFDIGFVFFPTVYLLHGVVLCVASCICFGVLLQMLEVVVGLYPAFASVVANVAFPLKMSKVMLGLLAGGQVVTVGGP